MYCAVVGEIINIGNPEAKAARKIKLDYILSKINKEYYDELASLFSMTIGDEFQGLMYKTDELLKIVDTIKSRMHPVEIRFGIGLGDIYTRIHKETPIGTDGPAYNHARRALGDIRNLRLDGNKYKQDINFCADLKLKNGALKMLNASMVLAYNMEQGWTRKQRDTVYKIVLNGDSQQKLAEDFDIDPSSVTRRLRSAGFFEYKFAKDNVQSGLDDLYKQLSDLSEYK